MRLLHRLLTGVGALFHKRHAEQELDEELRTYLDVAVERKVHAGMGHEEAVRAARVEMGSLEAVKDHTRDAGWESRIESIWQDVRYAVRGLRRSPGFAAVAILTLALGIGANTAIYSAIDAAFFRPLTFPQPEQLVRLSEVAVPLDVRGLIRASGAPASVTPQRQTRLELTNLYERRDVFSASAAHATGGLNLGTGPEPLRIEATFVTSEFFAVFRRQPVLGRVFAPEESSADGPRVTVLSHRLWRSHFGGDPVIVGTRVTLDEVPHEVVGVMPDDFRFPAVADLWVPLPVPAPMSIMTAFRNFLPSQVVARLASGMTLRMAVDRLDVIRQPYIENLRALPGPALPVTPSAALVTPLQRSLVGDRRTALMVLMAGAALVLLIACVNVATLMLSRATTRRPEIATRLALGASRGRILRHLLIESVILALGGAVLGLAVARTGLSGLSALLPPQLAGLAPPTIDQRVLVFTLVAAVSTGVVFGLWPAFSSSRQVPRDELSGSGNRVMIVASRLKSGLVVAEVALAFLLVVAAGLMLTSLRSLLTTELGMRVDRVATARINLPSATYRDAPALAAFIQATLERLREATGVEHAAAINTLPLGQESGIKLLVVAEGAPPLSEETLDSRQFAPYLVVSPGYFQTMGIPLLRGRDLAWTDDPLYPVAVVNRTMAQALWPGADAIGQRFLFPTGALRTIVGVVEDVRISELGAEPGLQVYLPIQEQPQNYLSLVVRGAGDDVRPLLLQIRTAVQRVDRRLPVYAAQLMEDVVGTTVAPRLTNTLLFSAFGLLALGLASIGVYGVLAYAVAQRTREIGIRMALGAQRTEVMALVLRRGLALVVIGITLGFVAAIGTTRVLQGMLYGVTPRDPSTFVAVTLLFAAVALMASAIPARRAARVDPLVALRYE